MSEYEKLSLALLLKIAQGINLQHDRPSTAPGVDRRYFDEWQKQLEKWQAGLAQISASVERLK